MTALDGVNGTVCNAQQYQQSLHSHDSRSPWISCLTRGESMGVILAAEASSLSCFCVIVIFILIGRNVRWYKKTFPNGNWKLFKRPADIYMFSLFVFDFLQALGGILDIRWVHDGIVTTGSYCTAQGIVEQIGEVGVSLIILLLAIHTFVTAVFQVGLKARGVSFSLVGLVCVFTTLWVAIGAGINKNYETPTPYWCWISPQFPRERFWGETIWLWIAPFSSAILYIPLYFWAKGFWSVDEGYNFHWWKPGQRVKCPHRRAALGMLLYPLAYCLVILPLTIARFLTFCHYNVPPAAIFFGVSTFYLSGAINVLLLLTVRPGLLLFPRPRELDGQGMQPTPAAQGTGAGIISDMEKFQHSPEPTSSELGGGGPKDSATSSASSPVKSGQISVDI